MNKEQEAAVREQRAERAFAGDARRTTRKTAKHTPIRDAGDKPPANGDVITIHQESELWQTALRIARGDLRRLKIVSDTEVLVRNR